MALSLTHQPVDGHTSQRTNFRNTVGDVKLVSPSGLAAATISAHDGGRVASLVVEGMELLATDSTGGPLRRELNRGDPAEFSFEPKWMWHRASDGIPDGTRVSPSHEPWDDTFGGVSSPPMVCWPRAMQLSLEADCPVWVVYTPWC